MGVESCEPIMHSGLFRLKHSDPITEQKNCFCRDHRYHDDMVTRYAGAERVQTTKKIFQY
jgi:hypothetical protein